MFRPVSWEIVVLVSFATASKRAVLGTHVSVEVLAVSAVELDSEKFIPAKPIAVLPFARGIVALRFEALH